MKVLICGSREWVSTEKIYKVLSNLPPQTVVIHGGAKGADSIAGQLAKNFDLGVREYPVTQDEWDNLGKAAGVMRNERMLASEHPDKDGVFIDRAFAFSTDYDNNKGTRDMVTRLWQAKIRLDIIFP